MNDERSALTWSYLILKVKQSWCSPVLRCETTWKDQSAKITETKWAGRQCLVPLSLLSWQTGKTKTMILKKKRTEQLFPVCFSTSAGFWSFQPFPSWSSFTQSFSNPNVFVISFCNYLRLSEILTHEIQGHGSLLQKSAWDSVRMEKEQSLILWVHTWRPKALTIKACTNFYAGFTL